MKKAAGAAAARRGAAQLDALLEALGARPGAVDVAGVAPMLCAPADADADALAALTGRSFELKLDGFRALLGARADGAPLLRARKGTSLGAATPHVLAAAAPFLAFGAVLDGEFVVPGDDGKPSFSRMLSVIRSGRPVPDATLLVFDVLALGGRDLRPLPLASRRQALDALFALVDAAPGAIARLDATADGAKLLAFARAQGLEGIVAKDPGATYVAGPRRTLAWRRAKLLEETVAFVVGWTEGEGSRKALGALELAERDASGALVLLGRVGSGLGPKVVAAFVPVLEALETKTPPAVGELPRVRATGRRRFCRPVVQVRVRHQGRTDDGMLRQPVLVAIVDGTS